jgi:hypothetical protein
MLGSGLLYFKFRSLRLDKRYMDERRKSAINNKYMLNEAFNRTNIIRAKDIGIFKNKFNIKQCP